MADLPLAGIDEFELAVEEDEDAIKTVYRTWSFLKIVMKNRDGIETETSHQNNELSHTKDELRQLR